MKRKGCRVDHLCIASLPPQYLASLALQPLRDVCQLLFIPHKGSPCNGGQLRLVLGAGQPWRRSESLPELQISQNLEASSYYFSFFSTFAHLLHGRYLTSDLLLVPEVKHLGLVAVLAKEEKCHHAGDAEEE